MTSINLTIDRVGGPGQNISLNVGEILFVLGANGTGKSSLNQRFFASHQSVAKRVSAHRQTWFSSNGSDITPSQRQNLGNDLRSVDARVESRYSDGYASQRPSMALFDLINANSARALKIVGAIEGDDNGLAQTLLENRGPISIVNGLMKLSNLHIEIYVDDNQLLWAKKNGGQPYSVRELSDGERSALLIAAEVLTAKSGAVIILDEPERHLHRSIISPLLLNLFQKRPDCYFIVSTHDLSLVGDSPSAQVLLVRDCVHRNNEFHGWEFDLLPSGGTLDEEIKKDILGARRKVLFVEGDDKSLDKALYNLIFSDISIIAKNGCREVEQAVVGIRSEPSLNWVKAFGIVDNDRRSQPEIARLEGKGVYPLSVFAVESIYYHPEIQRRVAIAKAAISDAMPKLTKKRAILNIQTQLNDAKNAALASVFPNIDRLSMRVVEKKIREDVFSKIPNKATIAAATAPLSINIDIPNILTQERARLRTLHRDGKLSEIIENYPIRETTALSVMAQRLGFSKRKAYEEAVRELMLKDPSALNFVKGLFGSLLTAIEV